MARVLTNENNYYDIAATIRQMKNVNTTYKPREMASALKDIYSNEVEGTLPLSFEANGNDLLDYRIDGTSGGVGDRTSNLVDYSTVTRGYRIMWATGTSKEDNSAIMSDFIAVSNGIYIASVSVNLIGYDINKNYIGTYDPYSKMFKKDYSSKTTYYNIADNNVKFVKLLSYSATDTISQDTMFCNSTTIPEYEPYGYKMPVKINNSNVATIYLDSPIYENESISLSDTNVDIPTIDGTNVITIDTTVQPSNVYIQAPKDTPKMVEARERLEVI